MSTKHTPGPWYLEEHYLTVQVNDEEVDFHGNPIKFIIARANDTANARLIAAAPELLEALQTLTKWANVAGCDREEGSILDNNIKAARAAIAKATGNTL